MHLEGIGELTAYRAYWRLVYDQCGHSLEFMRAGREDPQQVETYIRRGLAACLTCQATAAADTADGRRRSFLALLKRSATERTARFGGDDKRSRRRRRP
jgi:hypothetical protein